MRSGATCRFGRASIATLTLFAVDPGLSQEEDRYVEFPQATLEMVHDPVSHSVLVRTLHDVYQVGLGEAPGKARLLTPPEGPAWAGGPGDGTFRLVPGSSDAALLLPSPLGFHEALVSTSGSLFGLNRERLLTRFDRVRTLHLGRGGRSIVTGTPIDRVEGGGGRWEWRFRGRSGQDLGGVTTPEPARVTLSRNGAWVAFSTREETRLFTSEGAESGVVPGNFRHASIADDGTLVLNPAGRIREVIVQRPAGGAAAFDTGAAVHGLRVSPDGKRILAWHRDGKVTRIDGERLSTWTPDLEGPLFVTSAEIRNEGRILLGVRRRAVGGDDWSESHVFILQPRACATRIPLPSSPFDSTTPDVLSIGADSLAVRLSSSAIVVRTQRGTPLERGRAACILERFLAVGPGRARPPSELRMAPLSAGGCGTWPLSPMDENHPVAATLEFQDYEGQQIHPGLDIPAVPNHDETGARADAQFAMVRRGGWVIGLTATDPGKENGVEIRTTDGLVHKYHHLAYRTFNPEITDAWNETTVGNAGGVTGVEVPAGTWIAKIANWDEVGSSCASGRSFHHLHYAVVSLDGNTFHNPLSDLVPLEDEHPPHVASLRLCDDDASYALPGDPWTGCIDTGTLGCTPLSKEADAVASVWDHSMAGVPVASAWFGGIRIGVRKLRYRLCPESDPACPWAQEHVMDSTPRTLAVPADGPAVVLYSIRDDGGGSGFPRSDSDYCNDDVFWMIPTNVVAGTHDRAGAIRPQDLPSGYYSLRVEAEDYAGNTSAVSAAVCPSNRCAGKLLIRDCEEDFGAEPSDCPVSDASPDVSFTATAAIDRYSVTACVRNAGCAAIEPSTVLTLTFTLAFRTASAGSSLRSEIPVAAKDMTPSEPPSVLAEDPWEPGHSRCYATVLSTFGAPPGGTAATSLEAWVEMPGDRANDRSDVRDDNNRAAVAAP